MLYTAPTAEVRETFHQGTNRRAYEMLGAHPCYEGDVKKWHFAVWAPNAKHVSLVGEFNFWDKSKHAMVKQFDGTWEIRVSEAELVKNMKEDGFPTYKYAVWGADDVWRMKADPFAFFTEPRPNNGSRVYDMGNYAWKDSEWMEKRRQFNANSSPVNIYEVHAGSWKRHEDGTFLTYIELADELIPYVQEMGYTHIELLPVMEHPLDMSWGYQVTGFFSATSRYGTPDGLRQFIDRCHQAGIGVILDWVPAHFPRDEVGLYKFDGTDLYNHPDPRRGEIPQWGTMLFDFARGEVCSYLLSSVCFWIDLFHADGIRVDAVSSIIYYDFCKEPGQYLPNEYGGRENLDGLNFLRRMNQTVYHDAPGIMMIAEESTSFPMITAPTYVGGLGFGFKWNMGWMNDILSYIKLDPVYRKYHHDKLTFSLMYAFNENYILPFSHDEVVHGKHSMLDKNPGDIWNKFAGLRALYGYTMAHPGKKLLFMGGEFAHFIEWKFDDQLDWFLLVYERHAPLQKCVKTLNHLYKDLPALHEVDNSWDGFQWVTPNDADNSTVAFIRTDKAGKSILCITNFTPVFRPIYRIPLPYGGTLNELFNTDRAEFGGSNQYNAYEIHAQKGDYNGFPFWAEVCVPPLSTVYLTYDKILPPPPPAKKVTVRTGKAAVGPAAKAKAKKTAGSSSSSARTKKTVKKAKGD
ncbi:MAG: 1,4-alpha-glucan branching protein GlgB [Clostridia bacterium]|nr:1,4-alpha-glucan branching protein GlgB [Clostridia bacterium]